MSQVQRLLSSAMQSWQAGQAAQAQTTLRQLLQIAPHNPQANELYAGTLAMQGAWAEAAKHLEKAVYGDPGNARLHMALGSVRSRTADLEGAIASMRRAVELAPNWPEPLVPLGVMLAAAGQSDEAETVLRKAIRINPSDPDCAGGLAAVLTDRAQSEEAVAVLKRGYELNPGCMPLVGNLCQTINYVAVPLEEGLKYRTAFGRLLRAAPPLVPGRCPNAPDPERKLRIGYLSPDLRDHPVARFLEASLARRDRERFEVYAYNTGGVDAITERLGALVDQMRKVPTAPDAELFNQIRADGIDILVELSGLTSGHRMALMAMRPAPVQATWIGCPSSTGNPAIDCRIVDAITDPPGSEGHNSERLVRLPGCFLCYTPPATAPRPAEPDPGRPVMFGSFNNLAKLSGPTIALWSRVLGAVPGSRLLLKGKALGEASVRAHVLGLFERAGLDPSRVECIAELRGFQEHLAAYNRIDIALDTTPYNGTTTTCEALWMGVPVIALLGDRHAARVSASLLTAAGMPELVAADEAQYVEIAAALAGDPARRGSPRSTLRDRIRASVLCDGAAHARGLEDGYRSMWRTWCSGGARPA